MMTDIHRFCVTLLILLTLSSPVRSQSEDTTTDGPTESTATVDTATTSDATTTTPSATDPPNPPTTTTQPVPTNPPGQGGAISKCYYQKIFQFYKELFSVPAVILQLIPLILSLILPLIHQNQTPAPHPQIVFVTPAPVHTAPPPVTHPPIPEPYHHHHHHHPPYPILDPFALHPIAYNDYALFGAPYLPFRTNDQTLQGLKKPTERKKRRVMKGRKRVKSKNKQITKQNEKKLNHLGAIRTKRKPRKRLIKDKTNLIKNSVNGQRKYRKKIYFRRQFNLPGSSSPVLVSSSDLMRGVNFTFKGKS